MSLVHGKDALLYVYRGSWKLLACAREIRLNVSTEFIETSIAGTNNNKTFEPTKDSFTAEADCIVSLEQTGLLGLPDMRSIQLAHEKLLIRFQRTSQSGSVYTDEAYAFVSNTTDTGNYGDIATWSTSFQGTGVITQVFTPTPSTSTNNPVIRYDSYTPIQDATSFTVAGLGNKYIVEAVKDGVGFQIITNGTPIGKEVKYTTSGNDGVFEWGIPFEATEDNPYILYRDL